jgi:hypothetical protein
MNTGWISPTPRRPWPSGSTQEAGVSDSWKMAPTLDRDRADREATLNCARQSAFDGPRRSPTSLSWLVSLVSSMELVGTIEESITRVSELVMAVKKYSYNESHVHRLTRSTSTTACAAR